MKIEKTNGRINSSGLKKIVMVDEKGIEEELTEDAMVCKIGEDQETKVAFVGLDEDGFLMIVGAFVEMAVDFDLDIWMLNVLAQKMMDKVMEGEAV